VRAGLGFPQFPPRSPGALSRLGRCSSDQTTTVVSFLLSVTFACGLFIAVAHVMNRRFIAPVYDVAANLTAFGCAVAASLLLNHPIPATFSAVAILCWLVLARRTILDRRRCQSEERGEASPSSDSN
jgi:hypothetical protein